MTLKKAQLAQVNEIKAAFRENQGRDIKLKNDVLWGIIERAGDTLEEMDEDQSIQFLLKAESEANKVAASDIDVGIYNLAHKLDEDTHATNLMRENIEHVMAGKINAVTMYAEFKRIYSAEELNSMPYPGMEKDSPYLGNYKPDIVKTIAKTGSNAGQEITVTWTHDFVSAMALGKQYETEMANLKKEVDNPGSVPAYKGWGKADTKSALSDATSRRNALRSMVAKAIEVHHMFEGVKGMPLVDIRWIKAKGDTAKFFEMPENYGEEQPSIKVTRSPKNLWVYPKGEPENGREFSVGQLISWDVATALKNGGTFGDLIATGKKGAETPPAAGPEGSNMTLAEAYSGTSATVNFLNISANQAQVRLILNDKKHPEHKDWVQLIGEAMIAFRPLHRIVADEYSKMTETVKDKEDQSEAA